MVFENGKYVIDTESTEFSEVVAFDGLNGDDYVYTNIFDMFRWDRVLIYLINKDPKDQNAEDFFWSGMQEIVRKCF